MNGMTAKVVIYATLYCSYCRRARKLLESKGILYDEIRVDSDAELRNEMEQLSDRTSVPQIFIGKTHVGGYDELVLLDQKDQLDLLLQDE